MQKYSILTIGDGLVAQIPALLGAMSAGLIVTRVTDSESDRHLGDSIGKQFLGDTACTHRDRWHLLRWRL